MNNAKVSGYITARVQSLDGTVREWSFKNAIMDYGLEYLANGNFRSIKNIFPEIILSDGEAPITLTDLSPNYTSHYYRSQEVVTTSTRNYTEFPILCNSNLQPNIKFKNSAIFAFTNGTPSINDFETIFMLREISLMAPHRVNNFGGANCAVFAKSKMKDGNGKPFGLEIRNGDIVTIDYDVDIHWNINLNSPYISVEVLRPLSTYAVEDSYETDDFYCKRVRSNDPHESVINFEVKRVSSTMSLAASNASDSDLYNFSYLLLGLLRFRIVTSSVYDPIRTYVYNDANNYYGTYAHRRWAEPSRHHIKIKYSRYNELPDLTSEELANLCTFEKISNLEYQYQVPNGSRIILKHEGKFVSMTKIDLPTGQSLSPLTTAAFANDNTNSPFYDVYVQYKELPLLYWGMLKGIDSVPPRIIDGDWVSNTRYSFYTETPSTLEVTYYGGTFNAPDLTWNDLDPSDSNNILQRSTHGDDFSKWTSIKMKTVTFNQSDTTDFKDAAQSIGRYNLDTPFVFDNYHYFVIKFTDPMNNTYTTGRVFSKVADYQPEDTVLNYGDSTSGSASVQAGEAFYLKLQLNKLSVED